MDILGIKPENFGNGEQVPNSKEPKSVDYVTECEKIKKKIEFEDVRGLWKINDSRPWVTACD